MSTSGKYGERQSWRRAGSGEAGKRRTIKALLTLVAVILTVLFLVIVLRPQPDPHLRTILVSISYDTDVVSPPMFADNVRVQMKQKLGAHLLPNGDRQAIRSNFQSTDDVSQYLDDDDDTVMVVLRGYLMLDGAGQPALACSDLAIGPTPDEPQGLLPLTEILEPLSTMTPSAFSGVRLVVLDVEPLAAHPALGQWNDEVFGRLDETVANLKGEFADRLWVLATRGPMQNVGWDHQTRMPLGTQTLLDGLDGNADLNEDDKVELDELCAFMSDRYQRLPRSQISETPHLMVLRGGTGLVDASVLDSGDMDVWVTWVEKQPEPEDDSDGKEATEQPDDSGDEPARDVAATSTSNLKLTRVALQSEPPESEASTAVAPNGTTQDDTGQNVNQANSETKASGQPATDSANGRPQIDASTSGVPSQLSLEPTFWDIRDEFESIPLRSSEGEQTVSAIALAPHLWRQLIVKVLGAQIKQFDPQSTTRVPGQVAQDLRQLQGLVRSQVASGDINDNIVSTLEGLVEGHLAARQQVRTDQRLRLADALQHAVAAARLRQWSWLEFQRQAAISGTRAFDHGLKMETDSAERLLAGGKGPDTPNNDAFDRQLTALHGAIKLFDRNVEGSVNQLLKGFSLNDPPRTWELTRAAWAWLRSPLPSGDQRRRLLDAINKSALDETDTLETDVNFADIEFATQKSSQLSDQLVRNYRSALTRFEQSAEGDAENVDHSAWRELLEQDGSQPIVFSDQFAAALRIDPRINVAAVEPPPILHAVTAKPLVRDPYAALRDDAGNTLGDSAVLRLDAMQDVRRMTLHIDPDRDRPTRLMVSFNVRSSNDFREPPVSVLWKVPGQATNRPGEPLAVTIEPEDDRSLPFEIRPTGLAEPGERLILELEIRNRESDEIEGVVGIHTLPIELPRENRLRLVASSHRGIGCSKDVLSDDGGLPGGIWLRTFNERATPFQLKLFNESGKACRAKVWMIKLPNPLPDVAAYWPDFAADNYSNPEGGLLDADGRIQDRYLREDRILKGPSTMLLPADQLPVALNFRTPPPADGSAPAAAAKTPPARSPTDVSHGMALVCRLIDENDVIMPENDQIIFLVSKPWAPKDFVTAEILYDNSEVKVDAELIRKIDGDDLPDEIPEIEKRPVIVRWIADDQWAKFVPGTTDPPDDRALKLGQQAGEPVGKIRIPVARRGGESWIRLNVDGWPRAIQHVVDHQPGSIGKAKFKNEVTFDSLALTMRPKANETPPPITFYSPVNDVFFKGNGEQLIATIKADFAVGVFNRFSNPEVRLEVGDGQFALYRTDRTIKTTATKLTDDGVVTLLTSVTDLQAKLSDGQNSDDLIPITATLNVRGREQDSETIIAVLDSTAPDTISIRPAKFGPYIAPSTLGFSITASDTPANARRGAAGIARIEYGLDTKQDGVADTQRKIKTFQPPVSEALVPIGDSVFKFQVAQKYNVVARAIDASGNERSERFAIEFQKPKVVKTIPGGGPPAPPKIKMGRLHGVINVRAGISGDLSLVNPPNSITTKDEKYITGSDRRFDFGPLPEGKYSLKFKGAISNSSKSLTWKDLEIDTTAGRTKPQSLKVGDAESE